MSRTEIYNDLQSVFRDVFDDDEITVNDSTTAKDVDGWDSLEYINLIVAIEKKFSVKFDMKNVVKFKNVGEMVDVIEEKMK